MKATRMAGVVLASGAIIAVGAAAAPTLELPEDDASAEPEESAGPAGDAFDGPPVSNLRGTYQARIFVLDGVVVDVQAVVAGTTAPESISVNSMAIPQFRERVLAAQSWDVDAVSGASYTSPAFLESLEGAFAEAGL